MNLGSRSFLNVCVFFGNSGGGGGAVGRKLLAIDLKILLTSGSIYNAHE